MMSGLLPHGDAYMTNSQHRSTHQPLFPNVTRVILHMILLQKRDVLLLKRSLLMMLSLCGDVLRDIVHARLAHAESSISGLPCEFRRMLLPNPPRRVRFNGTRNFRRGIRRPHANQHVNMINVTIHDQCSPAHFANNPAKVRKEILPEFGLDQRPSPLGRENQMQQNVSRCMRHSLSPLRGLHPNRLTPTAHTVGCTLPPLRGCTRGKHNEKALTHFRLASEPTFDHDCYGVSKAVTDVTKRKSTFQIGNRHRLIWAYNSASFAVKRSAERRIAIVSFASFLSPFWGSHLKSTLTHGLRRGLRSVAPSELSGRDTHSMGTYPAPTGQKSTAHGVSRGSRTLNAHPAPKGPEETQSSFHSEGPPPEPKQ